MDKNVLIQYCDMKEEIKDLRRRITETEKQIFRIAEEGTVKDTVSGGMGGIQHFVVEGMPVPELSRKRLLLNKRKAMLIEKENELLELMNHPVIRVSVQIENHIIHCKAGIINPFHQFSGSLIHQQTPPIINGRSRAGKIVPRLNAVSSAYGCCQD